MKRARTLCELYSFSGFRAAAQFRGVFGDPDLRVVQLRRKKRLAPVPVVAANAVRSMIGVCRKRGIFLPGAFASCWSLSGSA